MLGGAVGLTYGSVSRVSAIGEEGEDSPPAGTESTASSSYSGSDSDTGQWSSPKMGQERAVGASARLPCAPPPVPAAAGSTAQEERDQRDAGSRQPAGEELSEEDAAYTWSADPATLPQKAAELALAERPTGASIVPAMKKAGAEGETENRPHKCPECCWAFKRASNLQSHMETHRGLKPHVCELCGKAYTHQGTLQQHKRLHTGERPYHCPHCDRTYVWSSDFRKHIRSHTGEKPYACGACGKDFARSSDLRKHERNIHANNKPYPCPQCGKTFNKPLSLLRHQRSHLGDRPFRCPDCGKDFAVASRMVEHQKTHSGVRPYSCPVCLKCFSRASGLAEHQALHSGLRPFRCTQCGGAFARASRLARHQHVHTGERPYECPGCGLSFAHSATLRRHQQRHCSERDSLRAGTAAHREPAQCSAVNSQSHYDLTLPNQTDHCPGQGELPPADSAPSSSSSSDCSEQTDL
ncbi:hypothetical protein ANANG_G00128030 [Anguilla anguilla]|uniref:C2H2-type domain-containing protein n=1 Tax=Anguilla anguilla TaxID=7936 RepID=A0A9D3MK28_ANGAN|nr:hypothetical protein ANANG_G00128030 [Anguilla anguilla]